MKSHDDERVRRRLLGRVRGYLAERRSPRAILSGIMCLTALAGFFASVALLKLGLTQMWLRYPLAVLIAWGIFLLLVKRWAESERSTMRADETLGGIEAPEGDVEFERLSIWQGNPPEARLYRWLDIFPWFDVEAEGCLVFGALLFLILLFIGAAVAIGGLIMEAETLLAEVLLDAVLVSALFRSLQKKEADWWMNGALQKTIKPVLMTMGWLMLAGVIMHQYAPEARSIGGVWKHWRASQA